MEAIQLMHHKFNYFTQFWNMIDLSSIILVIACMGCSFAEVDDEIYVPLSAVAVLILWLRAFYFLRIFLESAIIVAMIIEIVKEMVWFLIICSMAVLGFGNSFLIILWNQESEPGEHSFFQTQALSWAQMIGDFNFTNDFTTYWDLTLLYVIWFLHTILTLFMLL